MQKRTFLTDTVPISIPSPVAIRGIIVVNQTNVDCLVTADNGDVFPCPALVMATYSLPPTARVSAKLLNTPTNGKACNVIVTDEDTQNSTSQIATLGSVVLSRSPSAYAKAALVNVQNTIAETSIITGAAIATSAGIIIPAGSLGAGDLIRVQATGGLLNNTGAAKSYRLKALIGGIATLDFTLTPAFFGANENPWAMELFFGMPVLDLFDCYGTLNFPNATGGQLNATGTFSTNQLLGVGSNGQNVGAQHNNAIPLDVSLIFNAASPQLSWRTDSIVAEQFQVNA